MIAASQSQKPLQQSETYQQLVENLLAHPKKLDALTSLRFLAAAMIFIYHASIAFKFSEATGLNKLALWQGVTFFFVLSGFILAYVHPQLPTELSVKRFLFARFARIWPTHCLTLFLCLTVCLSGDVEGGWSVLIVNLLALQSWTLNAHYWLALNSASWSISVEFFFYLCFPLLIKSFDKTWCRKLLLGIGFAMLSVLAMMYAQFNTIGHFYAGSFNEITVNPLCRLFEFIVGMSTALAFKNFSGAFKPTVRSATLIEAAVLACVTGAVILPFNWRCPESFSCLEPLRAWLYFGGVAPVYGALIFVVACARGKISQLLSSSILVHLGDISFSLYMIHGIVLGWFTLHASYFQSWTLWQKLMCTVILSLLLARISYKLFETPCQNFLINLSKGNYQKSDVRNWISLSFLSRLPLIDLSITLIIICCLGLGSLFWRSEFNPISSTHAREIIAKEKFQVQNILFGNQFFLRASKQYKDGKGLHIGLIWESTRRQRLDYLTTVSLVDENGAYLSKTAYPQAPCLPIVKAGKMWLENIDVKLRKPNGNQITSVLISVVNGKDELLYVQNGARDATRRQFILFAF